SVVGAASQFGRVALEVATTVKLTRALWIIPVALFASFYFRRPGSKVKIPWFIGMFVGAMVAGTFIPGVQAIAGPITGMARSGLTLSIFLLSSGTSRNIFSLAGSREFAMGLILWLMVAVITLAAVRLFLPAPEVMCSLP
ncbi:MAG TPA: putative sulfate exporter family transporter, partial [Phnomibacter sp.]|nr:putative sulfate exporter family transporter [Phnomibacter sp.]